MHVAKTYKAILSLYLLSLMVNLLFGLAVGYRPSIPSLDDDEIEYLKLAGQILSGEIEFNGRRTLGFPFVLAGLSQIASSVLALQVMISMIYSLSAPLLFLLLRKVTGATLPSLLAALCLAMWPPALFYGNSLYSESVALPVFLSTLILLPVGARALGAEPSGREERSAVSLLGFVLAGIALGITIHFRPMYLIFIPCAFVIILIECGRWRMALMRSVALSAGLLVMILPWSIYVSQQLGRPLFVTSNSGETLAGGMTPELIVRNKETFILAQRQTWIGPGKWIPPNETGYLSQAEQGLSYIEQDHLLKSRTLRWMADNPATAAYIEASKLLYMWGIYPMTLNGPKQILFGNLPTIFLLLLSLGLYVASPRTAWRSVRFLILPVFVSGVAMISWGSWRFRMPGDVGLISYCAIEGVRQWQRRSSDPAQLG